MEATRPDRDVELLIGHASIYHGGVTKRRHSERYRRRASKNSLGAGDEP